MPREFSKLAITCFVFLCFAIGLRGSPLAYTAADIVYVYDELGHLVGVVDQSGDAVRYSYDSVGNLLGISRWSATTCAIIVFTPGQGAVGASVTIYGTGFSTTPASNTVSFNG